MDKDKGVKIYLIPETKILKWIKVQDLNVSVEKKEIGIGWVHILTIKGGEADFYPGGGGRVGIIMPGSSRPRMAFAPLKVLQITSLRGQLLVKNWYFCNKCFRNTGELMTTLRQSAELEDNSEVDMKCSVCGSSWRVKI